jgi:hypothetical protein
MFVSTVPWALMILGTAIALVGSGFAALGLALSWAAAVSAGFLLPVLLRLDRSSRVFVDIVGLIATLTVFAALGGFWFAPAIAAKLALDIRHARRAASHRVTFADAD